MKSIVTALTVLLLACGVTHGQDEPGPGFEHLKSCGPFIGTWRYEGPLLEEVPDFAAKGSDVVFQLSWKRILNKSAVEYNWLVKFDNGTELSGKDLIGWNADQDEIVQGGMSSTGAIRMGSVTFDTEAKSMTMTTKGIAGDGEETTIKSVAKKTGKDTLTWKALERTGGLIEGPSPVCTLMRVERKKKAAE